MIPSNKTPIFRIKGMPESNSAYEDKYVISDGENVILSDGESLASFFNASNIVDGFKINSVNNNIINYSSGSLISNKVNGYQQILNIEADEKDYTKTFEEGGLVDKIRTKQWEQSVLSSNTNGYMTVTASSNASNAWKMFNGTNINASDAWVVNNVTFPQTIQIDLKYAINPEKFIIQNINSADFGGTPITFKILGKVSNRWRTLIDINGIEDSVEHKLSNEWNEYNCSTDALIRQYKIEIYSTLDGETLSIGRIELIGKYKGITLPESLYRIFAIGDGEHTDVISSVEEHPELPEGYIYDVKIGEYYLDKDYNMLRFYPMLDINSAYQHGFVAFETINANHSLRVYNDGWRVEWGYSLQPTNIVFYSAFVNTPVIATKGSTNLTTTGVTTPSGYWKYEGY